MTTLSTNLLIPQGRPAVLGVLFVVLLIATITDLQRRRIPNILTLPAALVGIGLHLWLHGAWGGLSAILAYAVWFAGGFLFYRWFGGIGAGDIKLLMACAALLGALPALYVAFASFLLQTIWLFLRWIVTGTAGANFRRLGYWIYSWLMPGVRVAHFQPVGMPDRSPLGPFVLAGAASTILLWGSGYVRF